MLKYVEMFHSMTDEVVKEKIALDMAKEDGEVRLLCCTNAAGLGVNYRGVETVISYGPPQDLDTFVQLVGRAGRTGQQTTHLLLYNGQQRNAAPDIHSTVYCIVLCLTSVISQIE